MIHYNRSFKILGTGMETGSTLMTNELLHSMGGEEPSWVWHNLGIQRRYYVHNEDTSDLATMAVIKALQNAGLTANDVDALIVATSTPDRPAPSTACIVQHKVGIKNNSLAFDINAVCSGFVYGLTLASSLLATTTANRIVVVGADTFSRVTDPRSRDNVFFGDGAGAVVVGRRNDDGWFSSSLYANGEGKDNFTIISQRDVFTMNRQAIFDNLTQKLPKAIEKLLRDYGGDVSDVNYLVPHQASLKSLQALAKELGFPFSRVCTSMAEYGNTAAASIPITLHVSKERFKQDDLLLFAGMGSGMTWGVALYAW